MIHFSKTKLTNGLRVIIVEMPNLHSVFSGIYLKVGSRFEKEDQAGISHFLEHLVFKGTEKYQDTQSISEAIEGIGGQLNAYTDQDNTFFYNQVPVEYCQKGLEILKELVFKPKLRADDIEREKPVIEEEIKMYQDIPQQLVSMLLLKLMGEKSSLARLVVGTKKTVRALKRSDFQNYLKKYYQPTNMVLTIVGAVEKESILEKIKYQFDYSPSPLSQSPSFKEDFSFSQTKPRANIHFQKTNQVHLNLGFYGYGYNNSKRFAWTLLNIILGEGMSSRLFDQIREKRGLCYAINSHTDRLAEIGTQTIQAGLNRDKIKPALRAILAELIKIREEGVSRGELERAKEQEKGQLALGLDDGGEVNKFFGEQELLLKKQLTPREYRDKIERVRREEIVAVAKEIYQNNRLNLTLVGPCQKKEQVELLEILKV
jgi:predicted Zn-dependent peptidase